MKLHKIQLLVVFLLLIALSVYVLRPSVYPWPVYEFKRSKKQRRIERQLRDEKAILEKRIKALEGEPDKAHLKIDEVSDTTAAIGLLQSQVDNSEQLLTTRMNTTIENELAPLVTRIEELESVFDSYIDESGNIYVNTIHDIDLSNKIKDVMQTNISGLETNINTNKESIGTNKDSIGTNKDSIETNKGYIETNKNERISALSALRTYIEELIRDINTKVTGNASNVAKVTNEIGNVDIKALDNKIGDVNLAQLTDIVGNNISAINDMSNTIATIIPYTEFRDDLRDTYREQYLQHLDTEH